MRNWSKVKVFFILILIIGTLLHFLVSLSVFFLSQKQGIGDYAAVPFLISFFFIVFATVVFCKKLSGFLMRVFAAFVISALQIFLFILTFMPFFFWEFLTYFVTPEFIRGDEKIGQDIESRFADEYGINISDTRIISYSSFWRVTEEFGFDLIVRTQDEASSDHTPKGSTFSLLKKNKDNTPFRFRNLSWICTEDPDLKITDEKIFDLLCSDKGYPDDTLIAEKRVGEELTITSVFFPTQGVLWITETGW